MIYDNNYFDGEFNHSDDLNTEPPSTITSSINDPITVSLLNLKTRVLLEKGFPLPIWVIGEISKPSFKQSSGHLYFTLKDANAEISAVFFRWSNYSHQLPLNSGDKWICFGTVTLYEKGGSYQLKVTQVQKAGIGELQAEFERIKQSLVNKGLIRLNEAGMVDYAWKRPIPQFANTIGIVSSPTAAGLKDMIHTINTRAPWMKIKVFSASVQGSKAPDEIVSALNAAEEDIDVEVIVVTRGGGSVEDLWCFNDERIAYAVANSTKPIISAIGHEVDFTICDFVADCRAATPTYAATIVAPYPIDNLQADLQSKSYRIAFSLQRIFTSLEQRLDSTEDRLTRRGLPFIFQQFDRKIDENQKRIISILKRSFELANNNINRAFGVSSINTLKRELERKSELINLNQSTLIHSIAKKFTTLEGRMNVLSAQHNGNDPKRPVKRGFAIVRDSNKQIIREEQSAPVGTRLTIEIAKGILDAEVVNKDSLPKLNTGNISDSKPKNKRTKKETLNDQSETLFTESN